MSNQYKPQATSAATSNTSNYDVRYTPGFNEHADYINRTYKGGINQYVQDLWGSAKDKGQGRINKELRRIGQGHMATGGNAAADYIVAHPEKYGSLEQYMGNQERRYWEAVNSGNQALADDIIGDFKRINMHSPFIQNHQLQLAAARAQAAAEEQRKAEENRALNMQLQAQYDREASLMSQFQERQRAQQEAAVEAYNKQMAAEQARREEAKRAAEEQQRILMEKDIGAINAQRGGYGQAADDASRQAYINSVIGSDDLQRDLTAGGLDRTGYGQSARMGVQRSYQQALDAANRTEQMGYQKLDQAVNDRRAGRAVNVGAINQAYLDKMADAQAQAAQAGLNARMQAEQINAQLAGQYAFARAQTRQAMGSPLDIARFIYQRERDAKSDAGAAQAARTAEAQRITENLFRQKDFDFRQNEFDWNKQKYGQDRQMGYDELGLNYGYPSRSFLSNVGFPGTPDEFNQRYYGYIGNKSYADANASERGVLDARMAYGLF